MNYYVYRYQCGSGFWNDFYTDDVKDVQQVLDCYMGENGCCITVTSAKHNHEVVFEQNSSGNVTINLLLKDLRFKQLTA